jgi:hypothetical protein
MRRRTGLDYVERRKILPLLGLELRPLGRPSRNQSLYRLRYPGSTNMFVYALNEGQEQCDMQNHKEHILKIYICIVFLVEYTFPVFI